MGNVLPWPKATAEQQQRGRDNHALMLTELFERFIAGEIDAEGCDGTGGPCRCHTERGRLAGLRFRDHGPTGVVCCPLSPR